jgi:hypothetical protein
VARPPARSAEYTVRPGDTLRGIAQRTLGDADRYQDIERLNAGRAEPGGTRFEDPDLIRPGWALTLPTGAKAAPRTASEPPREADSRRAPAPSARSASRGGGHRAARTAGSLGTWIDEAIDVLNRHGYTVSYDAIYETVIHESGGDPQAVNGTDWNAAQGHPSIGLMQTIQSTFDEFALPGYEDIYNPVDNIVAAVRYATKVYGSLDDVVAARCGGSCWRGY